MSFVVKIGPSKSWAFALLLLSLSVFNTAFPQAERFAPGTSSSDGQALKEFEEKLENLRQQLKIPGMAAAVLKNQQLIWAKGFGYADLENKIEASINTPWHIASVTKTFATIILLQLVEEGKVSLNDPLEKFGIHVKSKSVVRVRHILTHTSELNPETRKMMFAPYSSASGKIFPHGLGWFTQVFHDKLLVWHFGWHPDHASALILKVPEKNLSFMIFANTDKLSQPFCLLRGNVLNSPAALLFLKMIVFPDENLAEIADKEAVTSNVILKTSGQKPVISPVQKGILICCLLGFLSAPILWTTGWILRKLSFKKKAFAFYKADLGSGISRIYALLSIMLCILFYGALLRAPFLMYWPELPGWFDGISLTENLFLVLPTLLFLLSTGFMIFTVLIWIRKYWSLFERVHFTSIAAFVIGYDLMLHHWNLIGLSYYWSYFVR